MPDAAPTAPTAPAERIESIDVVRGFALLGILLLNILAFALPFRAYMDPSVDGATSGVDFGIYIGVELFAEGVMRALFSMLFGAGVVMFATGDRAKGKGVYYRRQGLLLAFGLIDGFILLWTGDILVTYALAGMVLYLARNWSPKALFAAAGVLFAYLFLVYGAMFFAFSELARAGDDPALLAKYAQLNAAVNPPPAHLALEAMKFEGSYAESFRANARLLGDIYAAALPLALFWDAAACMLLGMALYKTGVLQGRRSVYFYAVLAAAGFGLGFIVNAWEVTMKVGTDFAPQWVSGISVVTNDLGRTSMALGYVGIVMLICAAARLPRCRHALAATGRMALSNYLLQSVFGFLLFHDIGLGLWNELPRHQIYLLVLLQWAVLIAFSVWWLGRYRFGPAEWLWRVLTYGRLQPITRAAA